MGLAVSGPNAEQIQYWNDIAGEKWVAVQPLIDAQIGPLGAMAMDRAAIGAGERVLDIGCGCGHTTVQLARRVGATGHVTGIDLSQPMLDCARQRAAREAADNVHFENADAQTQVFPPDSFDVLYSRFGVMFFAHPEQAFANLCAALRPGGRLAFVCWQALKDNPWMVVPLAAAAAHLPPLPLPAPGAPGPFAFADAARVEGILTLAGFVDVAFEAVCEPLALGGGGQGLDQTVEFLLQMGPAAKALRDANDPALRPRVAAAIREAIAPFVTPAGVRMGSAAWIVTARRPRAAS